MLKIYSRDMSYESKDLASKERTMHTQLSAHPPLPFDQQANESEKAFAAFRQYLEMGPERSLAALARESGKSKSALEYLSRTYSWARRVQAHAAHVAALERESVELLIREKAPEWLRRQQELREQEWAVHQKCLVAAQRALDAFMAREKVTVSLTEIARIVEVASRIARLASGLSTSNTEITGRDGGPIQIEIEAALDKVYGKPIHGEVIDIPVDNPPEHSAEP